MLVYSQDDAFRFLARQTFRKLAVREVLSTSVPADAAKMMEQVPDIALVDTHGELALALAFLQRVRAADPEIPVLLVARGADRPQLGPLLELGVDGVVPKPVSGHELTHRVSDSLKAPTRLPTPKPPEPPAPAKPASSGGGTYGGAETAAPKTPSGGSYGDDAPAPVKPSGGSYGDDAPTPAKASGGALEALTDALPEALRPKRRRPEEAEAAAAERARWLDELAEAGHQSRSGKDVAGLNVDAIVAAHLHWLTSQGAEGKRAEFRKMDLAGVALAGTVLANAGFREADLSDAQLAEARLDGADFRYASLSAADLSAANLAVAHLRHCDLRLANLQGASLRGADLSGAKLRGAKLAGADFKGATLVGCDLSEADLSKADNLTQAQVDKAVCDAKTKLPPGIGRPRRDGD